MFRYNELKVSIELIEMVHCQKLHRAFGVYLLLKAMCDGHLDYTQELRATVKDKSGIKSDRSLDRYLKQLIQLNWIGLDSAHNTIYIRSLNYLRKTYYFQGRWSVPFDVTEHSPMITGFIHAAIITDEVKRRERGRIAKIKEKASKSALAKESALQDLIASKDISAYIGLSNSKIGELLGVGKSQADRIKKALVANRLLSCKAQYKIAAIISAPDFKLISHLPTNKRYSFRKRNGRYQVLERQFDELIPHLPLINQRSLIKRLFC